LEVENEEIRGGLGVIYQLGLDVTAIELGIS
jgi:hypothetical protein